jgi:hypothetical protein
VNSQEFFARKAAPSRAAFFVHGERFRNSNPDRFVAMRQIDKWTDAICTAKFLFAAIALIIRQ